MCRAVRRPGLGSLSMICASRLLSCQVLGSWPACLVSGRKSSRLESTVRVPGPGGEAVLVSCQMAPGQTT